MHTGFVFSADVIAEKTKQYIHDNNLTMDLDNLKISRKWLLQERVEDEIIKRVENDLRVEMDNEDITIQQPVSNLAFELFKNSLNGYEEKQITFDNIIPLVHAMFKGNWGIEVTVNNPSIQGIDMPDIYVRIEEGVYANRPLPNRWYISSVEFVEDDPIK